MTASVGILMLGLKSSQTERAIKGIVGFRASPHCGQPELAFAYPSKFCWQFFKLEAMTWGKGALHFCSRVTSVAQDGGRRNASHVSTWECKGDPPKPGVADSTRQPPWAWWYRSSSCTRRSATFVFGSTAPARTGAFEPTRPFVVIIFEGTATGSLLQFFMAESAGTVILLVF